MKSGVWTIKAQASHKSVRGRPQRSEPSSSMLMIPALCSLQEGRGHIAYSHYSPFSDQRPDKWTSYKLVHSSSLLTAEPRCKNRYRMMSPSQEPTPYDKRTPENQEYNCVLYSLLLLFPLDEERRRHHRIQDVMESGKWKSIQDSNASLSLISCPIYKEEV